MIQHKREQEISDKRRHHPGHKALLVRMFLIKSQQRHPRFGEQGRRVPKRAQHPQNESGTEHGKMVQMMLNVMHASGLRKERFWGGIESRVRRRSLSSKNYGSQPGVFTPPRSMITA